MTQPGSRSRVRISGTSVVGPKHLRQPHPTQDAGLTLKLADGDAVVQAFGSATSHAPPTKLYESLLRNITTSPPAVIMAVSDGHGSRRHPRSGEGANVAVWAAIAVGMRLLQLGDDFPTLNDFSKERLQHEFVGYWKSSILDIGKEPLGRDEGRDNHLWLEEFGATAIAIVLTEEAALAWQIGDGELVLIDKSGHVEQPLAQPTFGEATESLCLRDAELSVRAHTMSAWNLHHSGLVILATDGLSNSYSSDLAMRKELSSIGSVYEDLDEIDGAWLFDFAAKAAQISSDDTTVLTQVTHGGIRGV